MQEEVSARDRCLPAGLPGGGCCLPRGLSRHHRHSMPLVVQVATRRALSLVQKEMLAAQVVLPAVLACFALVIDSMYRHQVELARPFAIVGVNCCVHMTLCSCPAVSYVIHLALFPLCHLLRPDINDGHCDHTCMFYSPEHFSRDPLGDIA